MRFSKKVSLEFKDNQIYMNVNFQNAYFKFQIQGDNNQYSGKYHTGTSSGSLMVEIEMISIILMWMKKNPLQKDIFYLKK